MKKTLSARKLEYRNPFLDISHTRADFGTFQKDYFVVDLGPRAGVVATRGTEILLTRQYRFLVDTDSWELPGGQVDPGELPHEAAVRECLEETGVRCSDLQPLLVYYPGLDNFDNRTSLFSCSDVVVERPFVSNPSEVLEIGWIEIGECMRLIERGDILDGLTIVGLLAYERNQSRGR